MKFKQFFVFLGAVVCLFLVYTSSDVFYKSIQANHKVHEQSLTPVSLYRIFLKDVLVQLITPITASRENGLPKVRLYVPEKVRNNLMSDPPASTKKMA